MGRHGSYKGWGICSCGMYFFAIKDESVIFVFSNQEYDFRELRKKIDERRK